MQHSRLDMDNCISIINEPKLSFSSLKYVQLIGLRHQTPVRGGGVVRLTPTRCCAAGPTWRTSIPLSNNVSPDC